MASYRSRLLSYILEHFMMSSSVNEDEEEEVVFTEEMLNQYCNMSLCQYIQTGSSAEQLYIPFPHHSKSDIDLMFEFPYIHVADPGQLTSAERQKIEGDERKRFLFMDYNNKKYPCYLGLYYYTIQELSVTSEKTESSFLIPDINIHITPGAFVDPYRSYFSSSNLIGWFESKWPKDATFDETLEVHGPSICKTSKDPSIPVPMDHVPALKCIHWPKPAVNWIHRSRLSNWPEQNLINSIVKFGCHIVPASHVLTSSDQKKFEWRLSFSICEVLIAKTLGYYQKKCYLILKALFDVHIKQDSELTKVMCSYYLKTILFWLCELLGKEQWTYETLYDRFIDLIDSISVCFAEKRLKHYFIPDMNLIDHMDDAISKKTSEKRVLIKNDILNMIRICEEHY